MALFGTGRVLERRQQYAKALRCYERALRLDPHAGTVLASVLRMALRLNRMAEADRYALDAAHVETDDVLLLSRLGLRLAEQGQWQPAAAAYE
jgi:tetratricopeptide (TPR) repeat protein